jgi:UDP-2-acetamido-2-deoxy-ribo-hexuluronate aminotransferase
MTQVPFIDLEPMTSLVSAKVGPEWIRCLEQAQFIGGTAVSDVERKLCSALHATSAVACANGTDAIILALQAADIGRGHKVAIPNLTFWATAEAVVQVGAEPILVDVDNELQIDLQQIIDAHAQFKLDAVIVVHLMGWASSQLAQLRDFCAREAIELIEDGAQSFGVTVHGESVYSNASYSTLSFYPAKVIGGAMDGGAVLMNDESKAAKVRSLANHGRADHYSYSYIGWNSRMATVQGVFLSNMMDFHSQIVERRHAAWRFYQNEISSHFPEYIYHAPHESVRTNGYLAVLTHRERPGVEIATALNNAGVGTGRVYPETIDQQSPMKGCKQSSFLERSRSFCARVFNLPLFYGISQDQQVRVLEALRSVR